MSGAVVPEAVVVEATPSVPRDAAEQMFRYLIFHRSLLGEGEDTSALLERYLALVENLKDGVHLVIPDPVQKATALLFELVMDEAFDPWEIDLAKFTQAYLERVRADGAVNFAIAGRLLYMAWSILYLQSEEVLRTRGTPDPGELPASGELPTDDGYLPLMETPEAVDVTSTVLATGDTPPLLEMVRHPEVRPVSLLELVRAFGAAEEDARTALRVEELRERLREEQRAPPEVLVHGDIPEHELSDAWEEILRHPVGEPFPFVDLWDPKTGRDHLVALLLAVLFLAREKSVELRQDQVAVSPVIVVRTADGRHPVAEEP